MDARKLVAEFLGTALLVIFAVGVATLSFGFRLYGSSISAGVVTTALAFGLVVLGARGGSKRAGGCKQERIPKPLPKAPASLVVRRSPHVRDWTGAFWPLGKV